MIECKNTCLELYINHKATFSFLYDFNKLQEMSEETLKRHCINLHQKLNSDPHKTDLYEELNLFRKFLLQKLSALDVLKFVFQKKINKFISMLPDHKILLTT